MENGALILSLGIPAALAAAIALLGRRPNLRDTVKSARKSSPTVQLSPSPSSITGVMPGLLLSAWIPPTGSALINSR